MHPITLESSVRAACALLAAGALPDLPGAHAHKLHDVGGMSPWLRLALGDVAARDLEAARVASHNIESMLGTVDRGDGTTRTRRGDAAILASDPGETGCIRLVDSLCREAGCGSVYGFLAWQRPGDARAEAYLAPMEAAMLSSRTGGVGERTRGWIPLVLAAMAADLGIAFPVPAADLSVWSRRDVPARVTAIVPEDRADNGFVREMAHAILECGDGVTRRIHDARGTAYGDAHLYPSGIRAGSRLKLTFAGATSGHPGYLDRVTDMDMADTMAEIGERLARYARIEAIVAGHDAATIAGCVDANGARLADGERVELLRGCLEAPAGAVGRVHELMGEIAMVDFGGKVGKVPCYPAAVAALRPGAA